jgi:WNK lysine deficient protein kinase
MGKKNNLSGVVIAKSPHSRYQCFNDILGRGAYKIVYRGYDSHDGKEVAWNSISLYNLSEKETEAIVKEINLLKELSPQCKYIINFLNAWIDEDNMNVVFITEIALSGTLYDFIRKIQNINMRVIKKWALQILNGLVFLHDKNIAHRDLKCNNIFFNSNKGNIFIGDFGLANERHTKFHSVIGTPEYMAPEMYEQSYDEKVDIYAFGMCLLEMITKEIPYYECKTFANVWKNVRAGIEPSGLNKIKNIKAKELILKCIAKNPTDRPSSLDLLDDPFFQTIEMEDNDENLILEELVEQINETILNNEQKPTINNFEEIEEIIKDVPNKSPKESLLEPMSLLDIPSTPKIDLLNPNLL